MKILIADEASLNRTRLRALLIYRGLSDEILLVEQSRTSRCYIDSSDDQSRAMHPDLAMIDIPMPKLA